MRVLVSFAALLSVVQAITRPTGNLRGRTFLDICASLNTNLVVPNVIGILTTVGVIDSCLCISDIPTFLGTNVVGILAVTIAGDQVVIAILTDLIKNAAPGKCNYPDNSIPVCDNGNPCGFICTKGFQPSPPHNPTDCVCKAPNQVCNGGCSSSCPSSTPSKREESWWQKRMICEFGLTACGSTASSASSYECVNTKTSLENCGGCNFLLNKHSAKGRDCSDIPGVASVSCENGACKVHKCMPGYAASFDNGTCYNEVQFNLANELVQKYRLASGFN